jgi:hypothetical protein
MNTRINLSLNTQASVDPANSASLNPNYPSSAPWSGASGYAGAFAYGVLRYAPDLGQYGSVVGIIGGHNGYYGNEVVRFDIATRQFMPLSDPYTSLSHPGSFFTNGSGVYSDNTNGEFHINSGLTTDETQPGACHPYAHHVILPEDAETGVGASGALVSCVRAHRSPNASGGTADRTHIFDLAQSNRATAAWTRYSTNTFSPTEPSKVDYYGWAVYDNTRKKIYAGIEAGPISLGFSNKLKVFNCVTRLWETSITLSESIYQFHSNAWHWEANPDYIINFKGGDSALNTWSGSGSGPILELINIATGQVYRPGMTGTGPKLAGGSDFVQTAGRLAMYEGGVTSDQEEAGPGVVNRVWILTPPITGIPEVFRRDAWRWSYEDITGPTPPVQTASVIPHVGRFVWADKVKCFIWWANGSDNVQAWNVKGFY